MAAIAPVAGPNAFFILRNATAQANTGQTDWVSVPGWARSAIVFLNITAVAGTTAIVTPAILAADPVALDDGSSLVIAQLGTPPTDTVSQHVIEIGPGVTGIADDVTMAAAADSTTFVNSILPPIMGIQLALDRTTGNETYTYTLSLWLKRH